MPLDYEAEAISIQATSRQEFVTRSRSVLKEPWTVHWIEHCFRPGDLFFDVGANIGAFSLLCARVHRQRVRVFAFEPSFATYNALCRNILHNGCARAVTPVPVALDSEGAARLFKYRTVDPGGSRHAMGDRAIGVKKQKEVLPQYEQTIFTMTLDEIVARYTRRAPTHIKIDVDGSELAVLEGACRTLADPRLASVMVELAGGELRPAVLRLMSAAGLELVREFDNRNGRGSRDAFFAREPAVLAAALAAAPDRPLGFAAADRPEQDREPDPDERGSHA